MLLGLSRLWKGWTPVYSRVMSLISAVPCVWGLWELIANVSHIFIFHDLLTSL